MDPQDVLHTQAFRLFLYPFICFGLPDADTRPPSVAHLSGLIDRGYFVRLHPGSQGDPSEASVYKIAGGGGFTHPLNKFVSVFTHDSYTPSGKRKQFRVQLRPFCPHPFYEIINRDIKSDIGPGFGYWISEDNLQRAVREFEAAHP